MRSVRYKRVDVTLSAQTFLKLEDATPFNKKRVANKAIEAIRVALFTLYPPQTTEDWKDKSRYQGAFKHVLIVSYDMMVYFIKTSVGRAAVQESLRPESSVQLKLMVPTGLLMWIERIAAMSQSSVSEAAVYAIEYGLQVLDSQRSPPRLADVKEFFRAAWKRSVASR